MRRRFVWAAGFVGVGFALGFYTAAKSIGAAYGPQLDALSTAEDQIEALRNNAATRKDAVPLDYQTPPRPATVEDLDRIREALRSRKAGG